LIYELKIPLAGVFIALSAIKIIVKTAHKSLQTCCCKAAVRPKRTKYGTNNSGNNPDGKINLIAAIDSREVSRTVTSRNTLWQSNESIGSLNQTLHMTNVNVPANNTNFQAAGGISVQLPKGAKLPQQIATLAKQPGNEYLTDLAKRSDIDWKQVEVINKTWDYKKEGITQEAAIIVAIVVTIFTAGAASSAGMSLATSAGFATTTTAAGATVMATAGGAALAGATAAAITTLATQAAIAMLNNKGDIAGALKELGSKENVKGLATAIVTAGLVQGLGVAFNLPTGAGTDTTLLQKLQTNLINGVAGSLVSTAINGGSLEDAIKNAVKTAIISSVAAQGAGIIGDMKVGDNPALNQFTGSLAHAILGCAVGSATAGNSSGCAAGAGGAVVGELSAEWYGKTFGGNPADAANFAKLTTAIAGLAGGANAMTIAGITSNNAVSNNYLNHVEAKDLSDARKRLAACQSSDAACASNEQAKINALIKTSTDRDDALQAACQDRSSSKCIGLTADAKKAYNSYGLDGVNSLDPVIAEQARNARQAYQTPTLTALGGGKQTPEQQRVTGVLNGSLTTAGGLVAGPALLAALTAKALAGDAQAQADLKKLVIDLAVTVSDLPAAAGRKIDEANAAEAAGNFELAARIRTELVGNTALIGYGGVKLVQGKLAPGSTLSTEEIAMNAIQKNGWKKPDGSNWYPPNDGAILGTESLAVLPVGTTLNRMGGTGEKSAFLSTVETPISSRSLPPWSDTSVIDTYIVMKPLPVGKSTIAPAYGQNGLGIQYNTVGGTTMTIEQLVKEGFLWKKL
jgi:filamentous hemagglutinin